MEDFKYLYTSTNGTEVLGFTERREVFGRTFPLVITYNSSTHRRQERTYERTKAKILAGLKDIKSSVERKGRGRKTTLEAAVKQASKLIPEQYTAVFGYKAFYEDNARRFNFWLNKETEDEMRSTFGKMVVFTDLEDWPAERIAQVYNRKTFIEDDFHWLKDKLLIPITPIWHRKDENIQVHVFLCVLGLFFVRYLSWKLAEQGITDERMMDELARIRVSLVSRPDLKGPELVVEEMTPIQARLFTKLELARYIKLNNF
jgi:transposase